MLALVPAWIRLSLGVCMPASETLAHLYAEGERLSAEARRLREEAMQVWATSQVVIAESHRLAQESSALARRCARLTPMCGFLDGTNGPQPRWAWRKRQLETNV